MDTLSSLSGCIAMDESVHCQALVGTLSGLSGYTVMAERVHCQALVGEALWLRGLFRCFRFIRNLWRDIKHVVVRVSDFCLKSDS